MNPEFFDIFGLISFTFIIWFSIKMLCKKKPEKWAIIILLIIGILGLIVDGFIVYGYYFR
jgi:hypothetical protein